MISARSVQGGFVASSFSKLTDTLGANPGAPPDSPKPLAAVLAVHRGDQMLAKFIAGAGCPTLKAVATMLEVESASLRRTIHRIEVAIGGPVVTDYRASAPLRLTPLGRRLVRQSVRSAT